MGRRGEMLIPSTTSTAFGNQQDLIGLDELAEDLAGVRVANLGAGRHGQVDVVGRLAAHVLALAVRGPVCDPLGVVSVVEKRREVGVRFHVHTASLPSVATVGATLRANLLPTDGAVS